MRGTALRIVVVVVCILVELEPKRRTVVVCTVVELERRRRIVVVCILVELEREWRIVVIYILVEFVQGWKIVVCIPVELEQGRPLGKIVWSRNEEQPMVGQLARSIVDKSGYQGKSWD